MNFLRYIACILSVVSFCGLSAIPESRVVVVKLGVTPDNIFTRQYISGVTDLSLPEIETSNSISGILELIEDELGEDRDFSQDDFACLEDALEMQQDDHAYEGDGRAIIATVRVDNAPGPIVLLEHVYVGEYDE